ncbi:MAG: YMGG-like glycine zipper-containing protein [Thermodesulfobacteriota bacterium]
MKKIMIYLLLVSIAATTLSSCATSQRTYEGAGVGGGLGAIAGALIDRHNRWRGAVIGGVLGAAMGGITTEISARAAREAAQGGRPVAYQSTDGWQRVQADPVGYDAKTKCHKVHERVWQGDRLVKDETREVCEGDKWERTY